MSESGSSRSGASRAIGAGAKAGAKASAKSTAVRSSSGLSAGGGSAASSASAGGTGRSSSGLQAKSSSGGDSQQRSGSGLGSQTRSGGQNSSSGGGGPAKGSAKAPRESVGTGSGSDGGGSSSDSSSIGSSSSGSSRAPRSKLQQPRPLGASMEMGSDRTPSVRGARHATGDDDDESEPLLAGKRSTVDSSATDSQAASTYQSPLEQDEATQKAWAKLMSIFIRMFVSAIIICTVGGCSLGIFVERGVIKEKWIEEFPPSCEMHDWADWTSCSRTCGVGKERSRRDFGPSVCASPPHPTTLQRERSCELIICAGINCRVSDWGDWGPDPCSEPCGPGEQTRMRKVLQKPDAVGRPCPVVFQQAFCQVQPCSKECRLSAWTPWTACNRLCGIGQMTRTRSSLVLVGNAVCPHLKDTAPCQVAPCPTMCVFDIPPGIPNAHVGTVRRCNGTKSAHSCHFQCRPGYEPEGPLICNEGVFIVKLCYPKTCRTLPLLNHSLLLSGCRDYPSGSSCKLFCEPGYAKTSDLHCDQGKFSDATCVEATCESPSPIDRSDGSHTTDCAGLRKGETCAMFGCTNGFVKTEDLVCKDGVNFNHPRCLEAPCLDPPPVNANATTFVDRCTILAQEKVPIPSRTTCKPNCAPGFKLATGAICLRGSWLPALCVAEDEPCWADPLGCGEKCSASEVPQIEGSEPTTCQSVLSGATCKFECQAGREKSGGDLFCAAGKWQPVECSLPACFGRPLIEHSADLSACAGALNGETCKLQCLVGYAPSKSHLICDHGIWRGEQCRPLLCKYPAVPWHAVGDYSLCAGLHPGDWCPLYCDEGFNSVPPRGFQCVKGGRFERALCEPQPCAAVPTVEHSADLSDCAGAASGSHCELSCEQGHERVGDLMCTKGTWTRASCHKMAACEFVPKIAHAQRSMFKCIDTPDKSSCEEFKCDPGYEPESVLQCSLGKFSTPKCVEARCLALPNVEHSTFDAKACQDMASGGICQVTCEPGYATTGDLLCHQGTFNMVSCQGPAELLAATQETLSLELELSTTYDAWALRSRGTALNARLVRTLADAAGVRPERLIGRGYRPRTDTTSIVDLDLLAATTALGISARAGVQAAQQSLGNTTSALHTLLGSGAVGAKLTIARSTVGKICTGLPQVTAAEGLAHCVYTLSGKECPLTCQPGHVRTGNLVCSDGYWNTPLCIGAPCQFAPKVADASDLSHCIGTASGGYCTLDCLPGFSPSQDIECRQGEYTEASCDPKPCMYSPFVTLGSPEEQVQCRKMQSGAICHYRCIPGYYPDGEGSLECDHGNWDRRGSCTPAECFYVPVVVHSPTDLTACAGTLHGDDCEFECETGYAKKGHLTCRFGQFESAHCQPLECSSTPKVAGLNVELAENCVPAHSGTACKPDCGPGKKLSEPLICLYGEWTKTACVLLDLRLRNCDYPPTVPRVSDVSMCIGTPADGSCTPLCYPGYELDADLLCGNGTWARTACEPRACERPEIDHSTGLAVCMGLGHGSLCLLRCLPGYSPGGLSAFTPGQVEPLALTRAVVGSSIECRAGTWRGPGCLEAPCDSVPPGILNAVDLAHCAGTASRKTCQIKCATGYYAIGFPECVQGVWRSLNVARCEEAPCTEYPMVPHALDSNGCVNRASGSECPLACEEGYFPSGTLRCFRSVWLTAQCIAHCAHTPSGISKAEDLSHCAGTRVGAYCPLICSLGFRPSGELHCGEGSLWVLAFCYDAAEALDHAATIRAEVTGLHMGTGDDLETAAGSFHRTFADLMHMSHDLVTAELETNSRGAGGEGSYGLVLRVLCSDCAQVDKLLTALLAKGAAITTVEDALRQELCEVMCPPDDGQDCTAKCKDEQSSLAMQWDGDIQIVDMDLSHVGDDVSVEGPSRAFSGDGLDKPQLV